MTTVSASLRYFTHYHCLGTPALRAMQWHDRFRLWQGRKHAGALNPLNSLVNAKWLLSRHYLQGRYVSGIKKVAWVTSGAPSEILRALGFYLIYPENHAAICGARKLSTPIIEAAEQEGYSHDICSYARTDIGALLSGKNAVGSLPKPDLLVCCTNICQTVLYWYKQLAAYFNVPLFVIDTPFLYEQWQPHQIEYVKQQLNALILTGERIVGRSLPPKTFEQVLLRAKDATELWLQILDMGKHHPSPITAFDEYILMAPIVDLRGEKDCVDFYAGVYRELQHRVNTGKGAIAQEKYRVLWDNLPVWFKIGRMSRFFAERNVSVVASTYTYAWGEIAPLLNVEQPLDSMAKAYLYPILNRSSGQKLEAMLRMAKEFSVNGVLLHSDKSCKPYSLGQIDQRDEIMRQLGLPALLLDGDHNDDRHYSNAQAQTRLEAFIEMMEAA